ncbi:MAG: 30S ribosomal protein S12 methylthiotransferase RimO [Muribaculaceae bacterium]|nr:30S ribosomal protein S12 methylthiotransferase RimO [Muribaculaceae bacterium]MBQ7205164.1 30S ribosomal protein S12 methylthiotransferase RimO [Muribaculaceae bacterium]
MRRNKIDIISLGCSKNLVDSEHLMRQLQAAGYSIAHNADRVDGETVVVNTCGFIADAQQESIDTILRLGEAKRQGKIRNLFVMGCLAERFRADLIETLPEVDRFYGKFDWKKMLADLGHAYRDDLSDERCLTTPPHYCYLKISEGCNRFCAFCAIPLMTGRHTSVPMDRLLNEVSRLAGDGVKEFNIIAQDLSSYGLDLEGRMMLPELIDRMADIEGVEWIRLHYAYPTQFPYDILPVMASRDNVCSYLDIALQHISDKVLTNMRRHISRQETLDLLARLRREVPGIHIRTTLMVGFPGEGEQEFEELMDFVREARFERMGAFAYSEENGTWAASNLTDDIPQEVKQERLQQLMTLQEDISLDIQEQKVGQTLRVIVDREEDDYYIGRTQWDSPEVDPEVLITKDKPLAIGEFAHVRIKQALPFELIGEAE